MVGVEVQCIPKGNFFFPLLLVPSYKNNSTFKSKVLSFTVIL